MDTRSDESMGVDDDVALAFAQQFRTSFRLLWRIAAGIVGEASGAEDVVQEAAVIALGKMDQFRPGTNFTAWMGQIVRYVALNHARKRHKRGIGQSGSAGADNVADPRVSDPGDRHVARSTAVGARRAAGLDQELQSALAQVSDVARACLLLRTLDGLDYSEIATLLGIPEGTAMSHVHRARKLLRRRLSTMDIDDGRAGGRAG